MALGRGLCRGAWLYALLSTGCSSGNAPPVALRLVDVFDPKLVQGSARAVSPPRTEWRFDGAEPSPVPPALARTRGWIAGPGVTGLAIRDGLLVGQTTTEAPILQVERTKDLDNPDQLHAVQVRARISGGANLSLITRSSASVDLGTEVAMIKTAPWTVTTPILPGERLETYTIPLPYAVTGARVRHVLLRPSDAPSARFAIESVRLVFRKEHLAEVPSGVSWQGMGQVFHETLAMRAPESAPFDLRLPRNPVLDVDLGTPEDGPVTFVVTVARGPEKAAPVLEHTLSTPHRWERRRVDLAAFGGARATLSLSLRAEQPGAIGMWGSPAIRQRQPPAPGRAPQGVILIQGDTLRIDHLDAYGYERKTAPSLTRMAQEGALFKNALAQTAWTKASTTSVMTSLYPTTHGVHQIPDRIPSGTPTLAERFRGAGYATLSLSSVSFTGRLTNLHKGFDELREAGTAQGITGRFASKTAREYVDYATQWLEDHRDVPFFIYLHVFDPHSPYEPLPPWSTLWADPARREEHLGHQERLKKFIKSAFLAQRGMASPEELVAAGIDPEAYLRYCKDWYDGSIRGMDAELARLLERLHGLGLADRTLIAFFADHGEEFHEHGRMWHGQGVYGEMIRIPLLFWGPGVGRGRVREETVQLIDVMPTLLELSGLDAPAGIQGQSLAPLLADGRGVWRPRPAIAEKHPMGAPEHPASSVAYAIVDGDWKLIHNVERPRDHPELELFAFHTDPLDRNNVADRHPEVVERLRKGLEAWKRGASDAKLKPDAEATQGMSAEQLEKLRSLGYVQ